jgi:hypothetical protein
VTKGEVGDSLSDVPSRSDGLMRPRHLAPNRRGASPNEGVGHQRPDIAVASIIADASGRNEHCHRSGVL